MAYKFVNADQLDADMAAVANAIRSKGGTSDKLAFPNGMISAISNISTGVELDFDVVTYASEEALLAAVPAENTIGVITTTDISGWAMGDYPDPSWEMPEGFLYINIKASSYGSSDLDFGLLKKGNEICIAPISAKQYVSGTYVDVTCKSYQNGAWADWWNGELYTPGNTYDSITGGWDYILNGTGGVEFREDGILFDCYSYLSTNKSTTGILYTKKAINLNNHSKLVVELEILKAGSLSNAVQIMVNAPTSSTDATSVASVELPQVNGASTLEIDLSSINGSYYIAIRENYRTALISSVKLM